MIKIKIVVSSDHPRRDKVGDVLHAAMREQMGASPWDMTIEFTDAQHGFVTGASRYTNEGRKYG